MTMIFRHRVTNQSLEEWISLHCNELKIDAVGLWQLIPALKYSFNISGNDLERCAREVILKYLDMGARPVRGNSNLKDGSWILQNQYGSTPTEIADNVIREWKLSNKDPDVGDIWFATKEIYS